MKSFLERLGIALQVMAGGSIRKATDYAPWFTKGQLPPDFMLTQKMKDPYRQSGTIHRGVKLISDMVASIPFELMQQGTDEPVDPKNPVVQRFRRPNARHSGKMLWKRTAMDLLLHGNAVWYFPDYARGGRDQPVFPTEIHPLPFSRLEAAQDNQVHTGWTMMLGGKQKTYPLEDTIHFWLENPDGGLLGVPEIEAVKTDMETLFEAAQANLTILRRGGPGWLLKRDAQTAALMDPTAAADLEEDISEGYQDDHRGEAKLLPPGVEPVDVGATQKDMDFYNLMKMSRENTGGGLGLVPGVLGILEYANYANMGAQLEYLYHFTVFPLCDLLESITQAHCLDRFNTGMDGYFKKEGVKALYQNMDQLSQVAQRFWQMGVPFELINDRLDLGFDTSDAPNLQRPWQPFGVVDPTAQVDPFSTASMKRGMKPSHWPTREPNRTALWKTYDHAMESLARQFLGDYRGLMDWLAAQVIERLGRAGRDGDVLPKRLVQPEAIPPLQYMNFGTKGQGELVPMVKQDGFLPPDDDVFAQIKKRTAATNKKAIKEGYGSVAADLGIASSFDLLDPEVISMLARRQQSIAGATKTVQTRIRAALAEGIDLGEPVEKLKGRVRELLAEVRVGQARTVARTEMAAAFSEARQDGMVKAGITTQEWLSARDDLVRRPPESEYNHLIDGETAKMGEAFSNRLKYPLDPSGDPGNVINCRCVVLPVVT